jgi:hypothetical protein
VLGCKKGTFPIIYLGLPLSDKRLPKITYLPLLQKFSARLSGWAAKKLSMAAMIVLINVVLSALPTYFMSIFSLPAWVIREIDKIGINFLCHDTPESRRMHLINWELVTTPKRLGGLGIVDLKTFNQALLVKWYWQWDKLAPPECSTFF